MSVAARREREKQERREQILDAAQTVLAVRGRDMTMDDVAAEAELGKGTLYLYFKRKEDLLVGLALRNQETLLAEFAAASADAATGRDLVERLLQAYAGHFLRHRAALLGFLRVFTTEGPPFDESAAGFTQHLAHKQRVFNHLLAAIERGMHDGSLRPDLDSQSLALELWGAILGGLMLDFQREHIQRGLALELRHESATTGIIEVVMRGMSCRGEHRAEPNGAATDARDSAEDPR